MRAQLRLYLRIVAASLALGATFGYLDSIAYGGSGANGIIRGAVTGLFIGALIGAIKLFAARGCLPRARASPAVRAQHRAALVPSMPRSSSAGSLGGELIVPGVSAGIRLRSVLFSGGAQRRLQRRHGGAIGCSGSRVLFQFVSGRYHRPRIEERVLLFIDLEASTQIAERLGELRFLDFLNRFVADVTDAIAAEGGDIHKYVGDEVIAAWPADDGAAACAVRACFAAMDGLARRAALYTAEFGQIATCRAGLHAGPVVLGELGYSKMEIALLGDTMNTAARIHEMCRETGHRVIASDALLARVGALPPGVEKRALGPIALRGKERALELYALAAR